MAYRMLGTLSDGEDAVQEAFVRWQQLDETERARIENPAAWLTRVVSRICLDVLKSARRRREHHAGPWLPEPMPAGYISYLHSEESLTATPPADPLDRATQRDSISMALLVVLETMSPAERVAFVLHDVFAVSFGEIAKIVDRSPGAARQLASSARKRVRSGPVRRVDSGAHRRLVDAFIEACESGDLLALMRHLDPNVVLRSDGGGVVRAALNPIEGSSKVARFVLGVLAKQSTVRLELRSSVHGAVAALVRDGEVTGIITVDDVDGKAQNVWIQWDPEKLVRWRTDAHD
jgi:RNA polymerase sigma factor (sigma-70 family)